jgi:ribulose-5-phosphate 4-epimerase/fuculose-1-phosphate aldolase
MAKRNRGASAEEGVTKFDLVYRPSAPYPRSQLRDLIAWRMLLWRLGLIGQDAARYGGVGFGNVSQRLPARGRAMRFAVSGTQTGALPVLAARHFSIVTACYPERNRVEAEGPMPPSSESLTHGMLYRLDASIRFVFHVHSPDIWRQAQALKLARTAPDVAYGTPAMAGEMKRLLRTDKLRRNPILVMGGHEDGVIAYGRGADEAGATLLRALAAALARLRVP